MTYYEELGLGPDATVDQVHQTYRNLARLLHPDQQTDETLRRLAESQMKRLNTIHETLTDSSLRRQYDAGLGPELLDPLLLPPPAPAKWPLTFRDAALLMVGMILASAYWQLSPPSVQRTSVLTAANAAPKLRVNSVRRNRAARPRQSPRTPAELAQAPREVQVTAAETDYAPTWGVLPPPTIEQVAEPAPRALALALPAAASVIPAPVLATPQSTATTTRSQFEGTWIFVRPRAEASQTALYPAEYVEAVVVEEGGLLRGRYRARYQVADRPISSEVTFRFEGKADHEAAELEWTGAGGSRGDLKLKLLSRTSMRLQWIATELGSQLGLASGTALLTRRQEQ